MPIEYPKGNFVQNHESRSILLNILRDFLNDGFIELETPIILKTPCIEENMMLLNVVTII